MKDIKVLGWDQHLRHILSKNRKQIKFLSERDFLNPKGMSLSGQLIVSYIFLSFTTCMVKVAMW